MTPDPSGRLPTVVIVDDAADVRALLRTRIRLSRQLDVVGEGADGLEAIELAGRLQPDVMLLDVSMPRMDGLEALPRLLEASPRTRVVMFTGFDERGLGERALELGATALLQKSASVRTLADELLGLLRAADAADAAKAAEAAQSAQSAESARSAPATPSLQPGPGNGAAAAAGADGTSAGVGRHAASGMTEAELEASDVLAEHLERFRELFEDAAIGMGTMTLTGRLVRANAALAALVQRDVPHLVGRHYATLLDDAAREGFDQAVERVTSGAVDVAQLEHGVREGAPGRRVLTTVAAVRGRDQRALYLFVQAQDVTGQRVAEQALRLSEQRFRLLVEAVSDYAIFMLDPAGNVASWNAGAQRLKGWRADEIIGNHFRVFYPPERQAERHPEHELELALRDGRYDEEGWRVRKDGSRFYANVVITPVYNAEGRHIGFGKVTRDVTEQRARHAEQRLRGPVEAVAAATDDLQQRWDELGAPQRDELLASLRRNADELRRLIDELPATTDRGAEAAAE